MIVTTSDAAPIALETFPALRAAISDVTPAGDERLRAALEAMCAEALAGEAHIEHLVAALKHAWMETSVPPGVSPEAWQARYSSALVELLALYFGEPRT